MRGKVHQIRKGSKKDVTEKLRLIANYNQHGLNERYMVTGGSPSGTVPKRNPNEHYRFSQLTLELNGWDYESKSSWEAFAR